VIIFISGSINSGKTTIAKILKKMIPNSAHIEVDDLRDMIDWMPLERSIPINLENTVSIINNFSANAIHSIVSYPLSKTEFDLITSKLGNDKVYFFTLNPQIEIALKNRGTRELTEWEKDRIKHHYKTDINNPGFGVVIDNSLQTPEKTAEEILSRL